MNSDPSLFSADDLHPRAASAIDADALELLSRREIGTVNQPNASPFKTRHVPEVEINLASSLTEPIMAFSDISGKVVGRYYLHEGKMVALREDGYRALRLLTAKVLDTRPFKRGFSEEFVELEIFKWWRDRTRGRLDDYLSQYICKSFQEEHRERKILVPLSGIEIESHFKLGNVLITPFDVSLIEKYTASSVSRGRIAHEIIMKRSADLRKKFGATTIVEASFFGEVVYCQKSAMELASDVGDLLRFMSPVAHAWNLNFPCFPMGMESVRTQTLMQVKNDEISNIYSSVVGAMPYRWMLSLEELRKLMNDLSFRNCSIFFDGTILNSFQSRVKTALSAYSQAVAAADIRNKIMYVMSAAEHLLLKDASEPIQASASDRLAFAISSDPSERMEIAENFKRAYKIRSKHIHHLAHVEDEETLERFFINIWMMIRSCVHMMMSFNTHEEYIR